ncbi:Iron only hydrogenase large subunit, C-terminal domain [Anaerosporobacter mobilis DSM 15930]|uniref:Iron only hydrogenase large subunit, C-terminal domain n=1 Tax=Anaerosporobacter mobilis DSM 15930 TaxID=1120996 RepID=A0A1M7FYM9_9FIRM|nr:[Fe-Fe] hydrogenase large subunit C-terminal domain-containing protein [Anaerosporobacter mobilis]SHM08739.1 Iron only hydrogenase large subunit, C-terminal domain [Anaerosporobacter mobilis DSM 15930]
MNVIGFKEAKCKNCYKCVRTCEVKAIQVKNEQAQIINDMCILCGHCLEACPQNAKTFISDLEKVKDYIASGYKTVISIAPSYAGIMKFNNSGQIVTALKKLGFYQVRETAEGAVYVTNEYERLIREGKMRNIITTSCPSANDLIEIYYPSLVDEMAPVVSPMIAHGKMIREVVKEEVKIVFLGPCMAKKREAQGDERTRGYIDAVINFEEIEKWLAKEKINITDLEPMEFDNSNPAVNRLYPISSGVISSVVAMEDDAEVRKYRKLYVHGIKNCMELFASMECGEVEGCFIEANICNGGCIKGPAVSRKEISRFKVKLDMEESIRKEAPNQNEFHNLNKESLAKTFKNRASEEPMPSEDELRKILKKTGKVKRDQELNCGACGYPTCRDKAIAVYQGKAELTMCIPYMHEKAQSMANIVLDTTPNIIIVVDVDMKIVEFSGAATRYFRVTRTEALNKYLYEFIDHTDFEEVMLTHNNIYGKKVDYPDRKLATLQNIVYIEEQNNVLGIFQDITRVEEKKQQAYKVKVETIEMAQRVIDKQMLVAQQIAGLLGETTAETKVTLTKLRDTILNDGEE